MNEIKSNKNRSDIGAGTRGADLGIDALEVAAINKESDFFHRTAFVDLETQNDSIYDKVNTTSAKRLKAVVEQCQRVSDAVKEVVKDNVFPVVISGDHSSALGTISGVKAAQPGARLGIVWIDAHADINSPFTTPSGNVHGMPIAAALHEDNLDMKINEVNQETLKHWNAYKRIGTDGPKFLAEDLIYFGVRDTEEAEDYLIKNKGIKNYSVSEIRFRGIEKCLTEAIEKLSDCDLIYITFDVDSLDCDYVSYGTGTPVPFGFNPVEVKKIITTFLLTNKVACLEVTEINPLLDNKGNKMAETAFEILDNCFMI